MSQFAVVEFTPGICAVEASLWDHLAGALNQRDELTAKTKQARRGEQYRVFRLVEVEEDQEYEWAVRHTIGDREPFVSVYVNARAARACCHGDAVLLRRRVGTDDEWTEVPR